MPRHPEPRTLPLGQVSHQLQQRHRRRLDGAAPHSLPLKTCALLLQCQAYILQAFGQGGALVARGPFSRGSSSDGLPSAVNTLALRVVAMAASVTDVHGGPTTD
jgi:hypothetical protein